MNPAWADVPLAPPHASLPFLGPDEAAWRERMEDSLARLGKRLGGAAVGAMRGALRDGNYEDVARQLIAYYDKLYDAHVSNGSGSGSGTGNRPGFVVDVAQPEDRAEIDAELLAELVLRRVREFEVTEAADTSQPTELT